MQNELSSVRGRGRRHEGSTGHQAAAEGDGCYSSFALLLCVDKEWRRKWSRESKLTVKKKKTKTQTGAHFVIAA